jgi:hypothetical protein
VAASPKLTTRLQTGSPDIAVLLVFVVLYSLLITFSREHADWELLRKRGRMKGL